MCDERKLKPYHESLHSPVVRLQENAGYRAGLGRPVPTVRTVDHHTDTLLRNRLHTHHSMTLLKLIPIVCVCVCSRAPPSVYHLGDEDACVQHGFDVLQPTGALQPPQEVTHGGSLELAHYRVNAGREGSQSCIHTYNVGHSQANPKECMNLTTMCMN